MQTTLQDSDGKKIAVWLDQDCRTIEFEGSQQAQTVPATGNRDDYRYRNGGYLYQEACELFWYNF